MKIGHLCFLKKRERAEGKEEGRVEEEEEEVGGSGAITRKAHGWQGRQGPQAERTRETVCL